MMRTPYHDTGLAGGALRFAPDCVSEPGPWLFDPASPALHAQPVKQGGRQSAWYVSGEFGQAVLRHYRRGGLVARLSRDRYIWTGARRTRSFAEFDVLAFLRGRGLNVPEPIAAAYWRAGLAYRAALLTRRIPDVRTLAEALAAEPAVAQAIFAMHEAGVWHADLNAYNILLDGSGQAWLIDFDRARRMAPSPARRRANLLRLRRSLAKVAGQAGLDCWQRIELAYRALQG